VLADLRVNKYLTKYNNFGTGFVYNNMKSKIFVVINIWLVDKTLNRLIEGFVVLYNCRNDFLADP